VRAVNLIPAEERRGAGGLAGRSGGVVYVVVGGLLALVALGVIYAFAVHSVAKSTGDLAAVTAQVAAVDAETQALQPYVEIAAISAQKVEQVATLAEERFNWPTAMAQIALAMPRDVSLTSFSATASSGVSFSLAGCANSHGEIPSVLTGLASVPGVSDVQLATSAENAGLPYHALSTKLDHGGSVAANEAKSGTCPKVAFTLTLDYASTYTVPKAKLPQGSSSGAQTVSTSSGAPTTTIVDTASQQVTP
jgi:Tfp pilus assembly protein PilN